MKIKCGEVILLLDKHLCLLLYTFSFQFFFCHSKNTPVCTFLSGMHFESLNSFPVYSHMFLIEGKEVVYLKMGEWEPTFQKMLRT